MVSVDSASCPAHKHAAGARSNRLGLPIHRGRPVHHHSDEALGQSQRWIELQASLGSEGGHRPLAFASRPASRATRLPVLEQTESLGRQADAHVHVRTVSGASIRPAVSGVTCRDARSSTPSPNPKISAGESAPPGQHRRSSNRIRQGLFTGRTVSGRLSRRPRNSAPTLR